ncbi:MAG TPA: N-acetyl-gamma-glutamyl-phosphate reductase [Candidatus Limnocylindrales bacterium]|nr:N-acetyl-gamma-glutamyl-phosphate reductase [Candidatus Limnocylindrales bacterium]
MADARVRVGIIGATGYGGGELVRLLERHPHVEIAALAARGREAEPIERSHPHLASTGRTISADLIDSLDAVFLGMPHGAAAEAVPGLLERNLAVVDLGPDFRLREPAGYPRWYRYEHPRPDLLGEAVYGLPELHRAELARLRGSERRVIASPGCYATTSILALAPLARAGLLGDVVIDAKSGVSGAGREPKAEMMYSEINESVRAYGVGGHRHIAEIEQELGMLCGSPIQPVDFLPHLVPMTRGILASCHVRPLRPSSQAELDELYGAAYGAERFVSVVAEPPATKHVVGSNMCHVHARWDERTGRVLVIAVLDNLVKGAAGQAVQAFNVLFELPEQAGLEQLPLAP